MEIEGEQMKFCLKKEFISWIEGSTDKILFLEEKYKNMVKKMEFCLNEGFISWIKGRTDMILFIKERISWLEGKADKILYRE
eukprot:4835491-Ditylum_brightwellii.AAC.1